MCRNVGRVAQSEQRLSTSWTVRGSNPGGARISAGPDRPWGPPSLLYNVYRVFPGVKYSRGVLLTTHPLLVPRSWKSRTIPLPTLWATTGPVTGTLYLYLHLSKFVSVMIAPVRGPRNSSAITPDCHFHISYSWLCS